MPRGTLRGCKAGERSWSRLLSDDWPDGWLGVGVSADSFGIWAHLGRRECGADHSRPS